MDVQKALDIFCCGHSVYRRLQRFQGLFYSVNVLRLMVQALRSLPNSSHGVHLVVLLVHTAPSALFNLSLKT